MSKPIYSHEVEYLGVPYWVEVEGFDEIEIGHSGGFAGAICRITGEKTLLGAQKHRARYWLIEGEPPTLETRKAEPWKRDTRKMNKWIVFYDSTGKEIAAYTAAGTFEGELESTKELLAYEHGISPEEITVKEEER